MFYRIIYCCLFSTLALAQKPDDLWLEERHSPKVKKWLKAHSLPCRQKLSKSSQFKEVQDQLKRLANNKTLPEVSIFKDQAYYYHTDLKNPCGQFRRTSVEHYLSGKPKWEVCFDLDQYNLKHKTNYTFQSYSICQSAPEKLLLFLSKGGSDVHDIKEYNIETKSFVKDGFEIKACLGFADWISPDKIITNATPYPSERTACGSSYVLREWTRGEKFHFSETLYKGSPKDGYSYIISLGAGKDELLMISYDSEKEGVIELIYKNGKLIKTRHTQSVSYYGIYQGYLVCINNESIEIGDRSYYEGCLLFIKVRDYLKQNGRYRVVYEVDELKSVSSVSLSADKLFFHLSENVTSTVHQLIEAPDNQFSTKEIKFPKNSMTYITSCNAYTDTVLFHNTGYTTPPSIWALDKANKLKKIYVRESSVKPEDYEVKQQFAEAHDGYQVPYFVISRKAGKQPTIRPTIIEAYGGFGVPQLPYFRESLITCWLDKGGVYVIANIRGGDEYGTFWHEDAVKMRKYNSYYDCINVARDLISKKITSTQKLGIYGASNGGLLTGVMLATFPDTFKAVASLCPVYDMTRFHLLGAGANWIDEYGDPRDPLMHSFLKGYSPYHNLKPDVDYPATLIMVSANDDRVHPGHARRMANKLFQYKQPVTYIELEDGGHGMSVDLNQSILTESFIYTFFQQELIDRL